MHTLYKVNISEEQRSTIFHSDWSLGNIELHRQVWFKYTPSEEKKTDIKTRRFKSIKWSMPIYKSICFFLQTLNISDQMAHTANVKNVT